uniref:Uncharacterized protein n=1 Tax=Oryza glumipatula TaxID=40148 RepID=A0A0E0AR07_9ORYZ
MTLYDRNSRRVMFRRINIQTVHPMDFRMMQMAFGNHKDDESNEASLQLGVADKPQDEMLRGVELKCLPPYDLLDIFFGERRLLEIEAERRWADWFIIYLMKGCQVWMAQSFINCNVTEVKVSISCYCQDLRLISVYMNVI